MKPTAITYYDQYKLSLDDLALVNAAVENGCIDSLYASIRCIPGIGYLKMCGYEASVLDWNSYSLMTIRFDEKFKEATIFRFKS